MAGNFTTISCLTLCSLVWGSKKRSAKNEVFHLSLYPHSYLATLGANHMLHCSYVVYRAFGLFALAAVTLPCVFSTRVAIELNRAQCSAQSLSSLSLPPDKSSLQLKWWNVACHVGRRTFLIAARPHLYAQYLKVCSYLLGDRNQPPPPADTGCPISPFIDDCNWSRT